MPTLHELHARVGKEIGLSEWIVIDQDAINRFADLTGDHQYIHVDPVLAARTPLGGTVAHGFFVLSLLAKMGLSADFSIDGALMGLNYGLDKIRLLAPVRSGKQVRGRFVLKGLQERGAGRWLVTVSVTVEIAEEPKPALVADWLVLQTLA